MTQELIEKVLDGAGGIFKGTFKLPYDFKYKHFSGKIPGDKEGRSLYRSLVLVSNGDVELIIFKAEDAVTKEEGAKEAVDFLLLQSLVNVGLFNGYDHVISQRRNRFDPHWDSNAERFKTTEEAAGALQKEPLAEALEAAAEKTAEVHGKAE